MIRKERNTVVWFEFELLQEFPYVVHGVFSRIGGISANTFASLNLGWGSSDDPMNEKHNRELAVQALAHEKNSPSAFARGHQVHKDTIIHTTQFINESVRCDGFVTDTKGVALMVQHADCQGTIFFDPVHTAIACVHAGWRGNVQNIYQKTIKAMHSHFSSKPEDLLACISPSLGPNASEFINYKQEFPESFWQFEHSSRYFNLWEIARWQLLSEGILSHHIEIAGMCTYSDPTHFFSYRREKYSGRNATMVWLDHGIPLKRAQDAV